LDEDGRPWSFFFGHICFIFPYFVSITAGNLFLSLFSFVVNTGILGLGQFVSPFFSAVWIYMLRRRFFFPIDLVMHFIPWFHFFFPFLLIYGGCTGGDFESYLVYKNLSIFLLI